MFHCSFIHCQIVSVKHIPLGSSVVFLTFHILRCEIKLSPQVLLKTCRLCISLLICVCLPTRRIATRPTSLSCLQTWGREALWKPWISTSHIHSEHESDDQKMTHASYLYMEDHKCMTLLMYFEISLWRRVLTSM